MHSGDDFGGVGHFFCLVCRKLCPCVVKFDDNSVELAFLIQTNKDYQVSRERVLSCTGIAAWFGCSGCNTNMCLRYFHPDWVWGYHWPVYRFKDILWGSRDCGSIYLNQAIEPSHQRCFSKSQFLAWHKNKYFQLSMGNVRELPAPGWESFSRLQESLEDSVE